MGTIITNRSRKSSLPACVGCLYRIGWGVKRIMRHTGYPKTTITRYAQWNGLTSAEIAQAKHRAENERRTRAAAMPCVQEAQYAAWRSEWKGVGVEDCEHWLVLIRNATARAYYHANRDKYLPLSRQRSKARYHRLKDDLEFRRSRRERNRAYLAIYHKSEKGRTARNAWRKSSKGRAAFSRYRSKYRKRPHVRAMNNVRKRLRDVMRGKRSAYATCGCSLSFFRQYIEARFRPGMAWDNYGSAWHIDHIKPLSSFDLSKQADVKKVNHFTNLQPLWTALNLAKSNKIPCQLSLIA